ncbi:MAG: nucleotide exchange factor GrpE [Euryarchaeota archaeon]|nr:nucleotide exchange factor GrpE [Euryarchaeota archaeon]
MRKTDPKHAAAPKTEDAAPTPKEIAELREKVKALEGEKEALLQEVREAREKQLRARADYDNLVKRSSREAQDTVRYVKGGLLLRVADLVETLEKLAHDLRSKAGSDARGIELVLEDGRKLLREEGLAEIPTKGRPFDYRLHQAVERMETRDHPESTILDVVQRGYKLGDDVVRPALVRVAAAPHPHPPTPPSDMKE